METLASILAGQGANPYQSAGSGIAPLIQQALLAQQMAPQQLGVSQPQSQPPNSVMQQAMTQGAMGNAMNNMMPQAMTGLGSLGAVAPQTGY